MPRLAVLFSFFAILGCLAVSAPLAVRAQGDTTPNSVNTNPYQVTNIRIDVQAENAVMAREKAFAEALHQGFEQVLTQALPDAESRATVARPETAELGRMIQDFSTTDERLSGTRYAATYELRFKPARVQAFINAGEAAAAPTDKPALSTQEDSASARPVTAAPHPVETPTLVLPFYQAAGQRPVLWETANPLREALQQQSTQETSMKFALGDLGDMQIFDESKGLSYDPAALRTLLAKYGSGQALIAMAIPGLNAKQGIDVVMYRADSEHPSPVYIDRLFIAANPHEAPVILYARTAAQIRSQIDSLMTRPINKPTALASIPQGNLETAAISEEKIVPMRVHFESLAEWQKIRTLLSSVTGVKGVRVTRLKTQEARIELIDRGNTADLIARLNAQGLLVTASESEESTDSGSVVLTDPSQTEMPSLEPASGVLYNVTLPQTTAAAGLTFKTEGR